MNRRLIRLAPVLAVLLASCITPDEEDIYGTYSANHGSATEQLTLRNDSSYTQIITVSGANDTVTYHGHWYYDSKFGSVRLVNGIFLSGIMSGGLNSQYPTPAEGHIVLGAHQTTPWSRIYLGSRESVQYWKLPQ